MTLKANLESTLLPSLFEEVNQDGLGGMMSILAKIFNEAMKLERSQVLRASDYERTPERKGYANGFRERTIQTRCGALPVEIPQVRGLKFYPKSLEKGCRSERALKLAIGEMYINGVSTRKVAAITRELCGLNISSSQVSRFASMLDSELEAFRNRELGVFKYVYLDARYEKVREAGKVRDVAVLIAIGVNQEGRREVLGISVDPSEGEVHWRNFLTSLKKRGLCGVELFISDAHEGMAKARKAVFPTIAWQRCQFHLSQNAQGYATTKAMRIEIADAMRSIYSQPTKESALDRARQVALAFQDNNPKFSDWLEQNVEEALQIYDQPEMARKKLRTVNPLELVNREVKRRTRVARIFPNIESLQRLVTAVLVEIHENWITASKPYLKMTEL